MSGVGGGLFSTRIIITSDRDEERLHVVTVHGTCVTALENVEVF